MGTQIICTGKSDLQEDLNLNLHSMAAPHAKQPTTQEARKPSILVQWNQLPSFKLLNHTIKLP